MAKPCGVATKGRECEDPVDKEMGDGFCTYHSHRWRSSKEFTEARSDGGVQLAAGVGAPAALKRALRPFKQKWRKRIEAELDGEAGAEVEK